MKTNRSRIRTHAAWLSALVAAGLLAGCGDTTMAPEPPDPITSNFEGGTEGWSAVGDYTSFRTDGVLVPGEASTQFLRARDKADGVTWYFRAPVKFQGDLEAYYGGELSYMVRAGMGVNALGGLRDGERFNDNDIILQGGGLTLVYVFPGSIRPRAENWTGIRIRLSDQDSWVIVGPRSRRKATEEQIRTVLADVTDLRIRGEYFVGVDWGAIDNVIMASAN